MFVVIFSLIVVSVNAIKLEVKGDISFEVTVIDSEASSVKESKETAKMKAKEASPVKESKGSAKMKVKEEVESTSEASPVKQSKETAKMKAKEVESTAEREERLAREKKKRLSMVTAAEKWECVYQYPESAQVEALLSNMMNQLAKVYVRVREFVTGNGEEWGERRVGTRFRVVSSTNLTFFDKIYANMIKEYRKLYNSTTIIIPRTSDPCSKQPELKSIWQNLIESSTTFLEAAVARSVAHFMKVTPLTRTKKAAVQQLVANEMTRVKGSQLDILCDQFQLCFNELL